MKNKVATSISRLTWVVIVLIFVMEIIIDSIKPAFIFLASAVVIFEILNWLSYGLVLLITWINEKRGGIPTNSQLKLRLGGIPNYVNTVAIGTAVLRLFGFIIFYYFLFY